MKWTLRISTAAALFGMATAAQAQMFGGICSTGGCASECCEQPCRPVVCRPHCGQTYTYQRRLSDLKPPCCDSDCCEDGCSPTACAPGCTDNCRLIPKKHCNLFDKLFSKNSFSKNCFSKSCGSNCCEDGCDGGCTGKMGKCGSPCEVAQLIYEAQTACHGKDRAKAVDKLGDYDTRCHPEVLVALLYSLNDCDERVRAEAADEIGDMIKDGRLCCSPEVVAALSNALGDCDKKVRGQAEEALEACGYDVVDCDSDCTTCSATNCNVTGGNVVAPAYSPAPATNYAPAPVPAKSVEMPATAPAPAPVKKPMGDVAPMPPAKKAVKKPAVEKKMAPVQAPTQTVPAPAPADDPEAYFPSRLRSQSSTSRLSNVFSMNR